MSQFTRRSMLKGAAAALPTAGIFALPTLARAIEDNSTPQQRPKVKITDIRTAQVIVHGPQTHVRVYTDSGLYGQGESTDAAVGTASLVHGFRRMLIGQDPLNVDALWERMRVSGIFAGAQGGQYVTAMTGSRDRAVGSRGQDSRSSGLSIVGRKIPRQDPHVLRLGYGKSRWRRIGPQAAMDQRAGISRQ